MRTYTTNYNEQPDGTKGSIWRNGAKWWHFGEDGSRTIHVEWTTLKFQFFFKFIVGQRGLGERDFGVNIALPFLFALYISFNGFVPNKWLPNGYDEYQTGFCIHDRGSLWIEVWYDDSEWCRDDPLWKRMTWTIDPMDALFGRTKCDIQEFGKPEEIDIAFPEHIYTGTLKFHKRSWHRPRWPWWPLELVCNEVEITFGKGPCFPGKGESSYDCGMTGLTSCWAGFGHSLIDARANITSSVVQHVIRNREKHGGKGWVPSVEELEAWLNPLAAANLEHDQAGCSGE